MYILAFPFFLLLLSSFSFLLPPFHSPLLFSVPFSLLSPHSHYFPFIFILVSSTDSISKRITRLQDYSKNLHYSPKCMQISLNLLEHNIINYHVRTPHYSRQEQMTYLTDIVTCEYPYSGRNIIIVKLVNQIKKEQDLSQLVVRTMLLHALCTSTMRSSLISDETIRYLLETNNTM